MNSKFILLVILLCAVGDICACKCGGPGTTKESFIGGEFIASGRVLSKELIPFSQTVNPDSVYAIKAGLKDDMRKLQFFETPYIFKVEFEVAEVYKGLHQRDTVTIFTAMNSASCGYKFDVGKSYIVYARTENHLSVMFVSSGDRTKKFERKGTYWTTHCTRTTEYNNVEADELRLLSKQ